MFPSPIGELHFSIKRSSFLRFQIQESFPSPIGELHFSIRIPHPTEGFVRGFRPLSGSYISQSGNNNPISMLPFVSVPYRGATFLNILVAFPDKTLARFRPLSGSYISQ